MTRRTLWPSGAAARMSGGDGDDGERFGWDGAGWMVESESGKGKKGSDRFHWR